MIKHFRDTLALNFNTARVYHNNWKNKRFVLVNFGLYKMGSGKKSAFQCRAWFAYHVSVLDVLSLG